MPKGFMPSPLEGRIASEEEIAEVLEFVNVEAFRRWRDFIKMELPMEMFISELLVKICNLEAEIEYLKNRQMDRGRG